MQHGPSHVLVIIVYHRVIFLLEHIHKTIPSGLGPKYSRILCGIVLPVIFPPMFDMGERLKERKGDIIFVEKKLTKKLNYGKFNHFSKASASI
jgi:hypothetical protein